MLKPPEFALTELDRRWRQLFSALDAGGEASPALRLRTEGFMEALVLLELTDEDALTAALERCYQDCFGAPLPENWRELFPFPQLPGFGRRAPVYPSTRD
jgi:hypothetical protein